MTSPSRRPPGGRDRLDVARRRALAHPVRRRLLVECEHRARTSRQLAEQFQVPLGVVQRHLDRLAALGLVMAEAPSRVGGQLLRPYQTSPRHRSGVPAEPISGDGRICRG